MKTKLLLLIVYTFSCSIAWGQKIVTLNECYERSAEINPLAGEKAALSDISVLKDQNMAKGWLPTVDLNGSFVYNSSVIDMGSTLGAIPVPGISDLIKPLPHEQYKLTIDINQVIYDGGAIKNARALEKAELAVNIKQTESDIYKLRSQINTCFFNILLLDRQKDILVNYVELITGKLISVSSGVRNGMILGSDADLLNAEKIKLEQQIRENDIRKKAFANLLTEMTGIVITDSTELVLPELQGDLTKEISRPEMEIFDLRKQQLDAGIGLINSKRMPRAFGFATFGYGNPPGSNFFKDEFAPYYIVGAGLKWNIYDWKKVSNEKQVIKFQRDILDNRKADLSENLKRTLDLKMSEINSISSMIEADKKLIPLRKNISSVAVSQYENGTISASEMLNQVIAERIALINLELHNVSLSMAKTEYLNISGKELKQEPE